MDLDYALLIAKRLAVEAGKKILEIYQTDFEVLQKEDLSPVTHADVAANKIIMEGLREHFDDCGLLSEEDKDDHSRLAYDYVWIVDPLDGTAYFAHKKDDFTVNIGLSYQGESILGVVYVPVTGELYYAVKGKGAFKEIGDEVSSLRVSKKEDLSEFRLVTSHNAARRYESLQNHPFSEHVKAGSSLKGLFVASGQSEVYLRFSDQREWDICALHIIIIEAGGTFTDSYGNPISYNKEDPSILEGYVVSSGKNHEHLLTIYRSLKFSNP